MVDDQGHLDAGDISAWLEDFTKAMEEKGTADSQTIQMDEKINNRKNNSRILCNCTD